MFWDWLVPGVALYATTYPYVCCALSGLGVFRLIPVFFLDLVEFVEVQCG